MTPALLEPLSYEEERGKPMPSFNHGAVEMNLGIQFGRNGKFRVVAEVTIEILRSPIHA